MLNTVFDTELPLKLIHKGKVRDIYEIDSEFMLIVTTDRLSAFDVVLPTAIPGKGAVLTSVANFWFERTKHIIGNHISKVSLQDVITDKDTYEKLKNHAVVVKRLDALQVEAIVRGYIIGSGWKDYQSTGEICGHKLPAGMQLAEKLSCPLYTPSTKASVGGHDENVDYEYTVKLLGSDLAKQVKDISLRLYTEAAEFALTKGIIIADTKFEFGLDKSGDLLLIDEVLTPDSSRFWPVEEYTQGQNPPSFDKQYVRDYLETIDWDKTPPGPELPDEIVQRTMEKYQEAADKLAS